MIDVRKVILCVVALVACGMYGLTLYWIPYMPPHTIYVYQLPNIGTQCCG